MIDFKNTNWLIAGLLILFFIIGLVVGVVVSHDYFYQKAEGWCNNEIVNLSRPNWTDTNRTPNWGIWKNGIT